MGREAKDSKKGEEEETLLVREALAIRVICSVRFPQISASIQNFHSSLFPSPLVTGTATGKMIPYTTVSSTTSSFDYGAVHRWLV